MQQLRTTDFAVHQDFAYRIKVILESSDVILLMSDEVRRHYFSQISLTCTQMTTNER